MSCMSDRAFVDTNVLVYMFDAGSPAKRTRALALVEELASAGILVLSTQILQEFYVTVTRKLAVPLPAQVAEDALERLATLDVVTLSAPTVVGAARRCRKDHISFWDALVVETALAAGCTRLLSEDMQHGRRIGGLRIENPFA